MNRPAAALAAVALAASVAGCGEKDEPETTGAVVPVETTTGATTTTVEPANPEDVVRAFLISPDADLVCDELITEKFLRASYGDRAGCLDGRKPASLATSVKLTGQAEGVVRAVPQGGVYDGDTLTFTLVDSSGGTLVIDSVESNAPVGP